MANLWKTRTPPTPIKWAEFSDAGSSDDNSNVKRNQKIWSISECANVLAASITAIKEDFLKLPEGDSLVWDKDDKYPMDFVPACANIRSNIFGIAQKSRFEIKCKSQYSFHINKLLIQFFIYF